MRILNDVLARTSLEVSLGDGDREQLYQEVFKDMDVTLTVVSTERNRFSSDLQKKLEKKGHNVCFSREVSYDYPNLVKLAFRRFSENL